MSASTRELTAAQKDSAGKTEDTMKYKLTIMTFVVFCAISPLTTVAQEKQWLSYGPGAELEGRLTVQWRYGPPNYGENPKTDARRKIPIIVLTKAINVRGIPGDPYHSVSVPGARRIQLLFTGPSVEYKALVGKDIRVKGALWHATTGGHYTDVVMFVESIEPKRKRASASRPLTQGRVRSVAFWTLFFRDHRRLACQLTAAPDSRPGRRAACAPREERSQTKTLPPGPAY